MATACTKHRSAHHGQDMLTTYEAEMPVRRTKQGNETHSVVLGRDSDQGRFVTLKEADYSTKHKDKIEEMQAKENQRQRVCDMNQKHFIFGYAAPTMQSEVRGSLLPPSKEALTSRQVRPIGGPNNKGASNLFISSKDVDSWCTGMTSTSRSAYTKAGGGGGQSSWDTRQHTRAMRRAHFDIGIDRTEWLSTSQQDYNAPLMSTSASAAPAQGSSVPLSYGRRATPEAHRTTQGMYGASLTEANPARHHHATQAATDGRKSNMVLGYDPSDFKTQSRDVFREPKFVSSPLAKGVK